MLRRRALPRPRTNATSTSRITTSSSAATRTRSSISSTKKASPRPTRRATSPRRPAPNPAPRRRAAKRSTCSSTRRICARITIGNAMLPEYRRVILEKLKRTGQHARHRIAHRLRAHPHAAGHPRPLPCAQRRDLRPRQPRQIPRRIQARQPQPRPARASTSPAARRIPAPACRWC